MSGLPRRQLLRAGALGGTSLAVGAAWSHQAATAAGPTASDWRALATSLDGALVRRGEDDYRRRKLLFNTRFDAVRPLAVVEAQTVADVVEAIGFARRFGLRARPRAGGHSYVGASTVGDGLVIDVRRLRSVAYDAASGRAEVGAGARSYGVHTALAAHGRALPTGTCPTVGVTGLTLGGGIGVDSVERGLTCDVLSGLTLVTADGRIRSVDDAREPDLLWAARGGGGGSFGVVTSLSCLTHPAHRTGVFTLDFAWAHAAAAVRAWASRVTTMPRSVWCNLRLDALADGSRRVRLAGRCAPGDQDAQALAWQRAIGAEASAVHTAEMSRLDAVRHFGGGSTTPRRAFVAGSDVVAVMSDGLTRSVVEAVGRRVAGSTVSSVILDPLAGAVSEVAPDATAFPWRRHLATVQWLVQLRPDPSRDTVRAARAWVARAHRLVSAHSSGAYVNYLEPGRPLADYYGENLARLRRIKAEVDPSGFFRSAYSV